MTTDILNGDHGLRVGVLVNDFGAINIDAALVDGIEENTISLTNGCVCCEIRDDLVNSVEQLLALSDKPEPACEECKSEAFRPPTDATRPLRQNGSA